MLQSDMYAICKSQYAVPSGGGILLGGIYYWMTQQHGKNKPQSELHFASRIQRWSSDLSHCYMP